MFNGSKGSGKRMIDTDDESLICEIDEFGNIIPETCEALVEETKGESRSFEKPSPGTKSKSRKVPTDW